MLDYHLERKITDRVTVVRLLSQYQQLTIHQICQQTSFSYKKVMTIIGELQEIYADFTVFHYDKSVITLRQDAKQQKEFLFHRLYQESLVLKVLTFFCLILKIISIVLHSQNLFLWLLHTASGKNVSIF